MSVREGERVWENPQTERLGRGLLNKSGRMNQMEGSVSKDPFKVETTRIDHQNLLVGEKWVFLHLCVPCFPTQYQTCDPFLLHSFMHVLDKY